jgi:hypothetical protein
MILSRFDVFTPVCSPWAAEVESHVRRWVRSVGLVRSSQAGDRFDRTRTGDLSARGYATAVSQADLEAATDWISCLFFIDDQFDEGRAGRDPRAVHALCQPLRSALIGDAEHASTAGSPLPVAFADALRRILPAMPLDWRRRFTEHVLAYFRGCEWEAANRADGRVPSVAEFVPARREAGAIWPSLDLLEYVTRAPLPDRLFDDLRFRELRTAAADVICWTDDILTVDKERAHGDVHNLIIVVEAATGRSADAAGEEVIARLGQRIADFISSEQLLPDVYTELRLDDRERRNAAVYVAGLRNWMRGHLDWGGTTVRYLRVEHTTPGIEPSYLEQIWGAA